jgi:hypothetical protein
VRIFLTGTAEPASIGEFTLDAACFTEPITKPAIIIAACGEFTAVTIIYRRSFFRYRARRCRSALNMYGRDATYSDISSANQTRGEISIYYAFLDGGQFGTVDWRK